MAVRLPDAERLDGRGLEVADAYTEALAAAGVPRSRLSAVAPAAGAGDRGSVSIGYTERRAAQPVALAESVDGPVMAGPDAANMVHLVGGTALPAGTWIETKLGRRVALGLADGSRVRVGERSKLLIGAVHLNDDLRRVVELEVAGGNIETHAAPGGAGSSFDVRTRTGVAGVRGIEFRVLWGAEGMELAAVTALLLLAAVAVVQRAGPDSRLEQLDWPLWDFAQRRVLPERGEVQGLPVVLMDDESLVRLGEQWPLDRARWAEFLGVVAAYEPAVVALDAWFETPSPAAEVELAEELMDRLSFGTLGESPEGVQLERWLDSVIVERDADRAFARSMARAGAVLLGVACPIRDHTVLQQEKPLQSPYPLDVDPQAMTQRCPNPSGNLPALAMASTGEVGLYVLPDLDGIVRRYPFAFATSRGPVAMLATGVALASHPDERAALTARVSAWSASPPLLRPPPRSRFRTVRCQERLEQLRPRWRVRGWPEIVVRIGLNSGPATVGNMGSAQRFDYTMLGDTVNLAARLEGANKAYGTSILVGGNTADAAAGGVPLRELDLVQVKGKTEGVRAFCPEPDASLREGFAAALTADRAQDWAAAREAFAALAPDPTAAIFAQRVDALEQAPPGEGWDGVHGLTEKQRSALGLSGLPEQPPGALAALDPRRGPQPQDPDRTVEPLGSAVPQELGLPLHEPLHAAAAAQLQRRVVDLPHVPGPGRAGQVLLPAGGHRIAVGVEALPQGAGAARVGRAHPAGQVGVRTRGVSVLEVGEAEGAGDEDWPQQPGDPGPARRQAPGEHGGEQGRRQQVAGTEVREAEQLPAGQRQRQGDGPERQHVRTRGHEQAGQQAGGPGRRPGAAEAERAQVLEGHPGQPGGPLDRQGCALPEQGQGLDRQHGQASDEPRDRDPPGCSLAQRRPRKQPAREQQRRDLQARGEGQRPPGQGGAGVPGEAERDAGRAAGQRGHDPKRRRGPAQERRDREQAQQRDQPRAGFVSPDPPREQPAARCPEQEHRRQRRAVPRQPEPPRQLPREQPAQRGRDARGQRHDPEARQILRGPPPAEQLAVRALVAGEVVLRGRQQQRDHQGRRDREPEGGRVPAQATQDAPTGACGGREDTEQQRGLGPEQEAGRVEDQILHGSTVAPSSGGCPRAGAHALKQ